jgi:hypothetical protein
MEIYYQIEILNPDDYENKSECDRFNDQYAGKEIEDLMEIYLQVRLWPNITGDQITVMEFFDYGEYEEAGFSLTWDVVKDTIRNFSP